MIASLLYYRGSFGLLGAFRLVSFPGVPFRSSSFPVNGERVSPRGGSYDDGGKYHFSAAKNDSAGYPLV